MGEPGYAVAGAPEDACVGVAAQVPPLDSAHDAHRVDDLLPACPQWLKDLKYRSRLQDVSRIWENGLHWSVRPILPVFPYPGDILPSRTVDPRTDGLLARRAACACVWGSDRRRCVGFTARRPPIQTSFLPSVLASHFRGRLVGLGMSWEGGEMGNG